MFSTLAALVPAPRGCPERAHRLICLAKVLSGEIYDVLPNAFHDEKNRAGEYVPLRQRRPSVRYELCRMVVEDSVSFLFGEGRFPTVECAHNETGLAVNALLEEARAREVFAEAATLGSVGSVAVLFQVLRSRVFLSALATPYLTPVWDPEAPDTLLLVREAYQIRGEALREAGYSIAAENLGAAYWHRREWTAETETWYAPQLVIDHDKGVQPRVDDARSIRHDLGFVPVVWIRNLPGGTAPDGACTFRPAIDASIEIDYQLSQGGRALKYAADPLLMIREPAGADNEMIRSAGNALVVSEKGDAKLVEISGNASAAVIDFCKHLRDLALESIHGNRASADRLGAAASGRAMELLYAPMLGLVDRLRVPYGGALLGIGRMIVLTRQKYPLLLRGRQVGKLDEAAKLSLRWPPFFTPTQQDQQIEATTLGLLRREGIMSRGTALSRTAGTWDIANVPAELDAVLKDEAEADARAVRQQAQVQYRQPEES